MHGPLGSPGQFGDSQFQAPSVLRDPPYNEAENIALLLPRLTDLYPDPNVTFLVVGDDESPDGIGRLVREFAAGDGRVHLLAGKKRGLGAAYVRGSQHALDALGAEVVVQMDADFGGLKFNAVSLLSLAVSYGTFVLLSLLLPLVPPVWLQGMAIVPAASVNYFLNSYWTFRESGSG